MSLQLGPASSLVHGSFTITWNICKAHSADIAQSTLLNKHTGKKTFLIIAAEPIRSQQKQCSFKWIACVASLALLFTDPGSHPTSYNLSSTHNKIYKKKWDQTEFREWFYSEMIGQCRDTWWSLQISGICSSVSLNTLSPSGIHRSGLMTHSSSSKAVDGEKMMSAWSHVCHCAQDIQHLSDTLLYVRIHISPSTAPPGWCIHS